MTEQEKKILDNINTLRKMTRLTEEEHEFLKKDIGYIQETFEKAAKLKIISEELENLKGTLRNRASQGL